MSREHNEGARHQNRPSADGFGELPLDDGIAQYVAVLRAGGVETFDSCQGGPGHALPEPTVIFHGDRAAGWHALAVAQECDLPVLELRRAWPLIDNEPTGPYWQLTFRTQEPTDA